MCVWQRAQGRTCRSVIPMTGRTDRRRSLEALQGADTGIDEPHQRWFPEGGAVHRRERTASRIWLRAFSGAGSGRTTIIRVSICGRPDRRRIFIWPISVLRTAMRTGRSLRRSVSGSSYISRGGRPPVADEYIFSISDRKNPEAQYNTATGQEGYVLDCTRTDAARCASHHIPQRRGVTTIRIPEQ